METLDNIMKNLKTMQNNEVFTSNLSNLRIYC